MNTHTHKKRTCTHAYVRSVLYVSSVSLVLTRTRFFTAKKDKPKFTNHSPRYAAQTAKGDPFTKHVAEGKLSQILACSVLPLLTASVEDLAGVTGED